MGGRGIAKIVVCRLFPAHLGMTLGMDKVRCMLMAGRQVVSMSHRILFSISSPSPQFPIQAAHISSTKITTRVARLQLRRIFI